MTHKGTTTLRDCRGTVLHALTRWYISIGPRFYELGSIVFVSTGINVLTGSIDAPQGALIRMWGGLLMTLGGSALFFVAAMVSNIYTDARTRQMETNDKPLEENATEVVEGMWGIREARWNLGKVILAVVLIMFGVGLLCVASYTSHQGQTTPATPPLLQQGSVPSTRNALAPSLSSHSQLSVSHATQSEKEKQKLPASPPTKSVKPVSQPQP